MAAAPRILVISRSGSVPLIIGGLVAALSGLAILAIIEARGAAVSVSALLLLALALGGAAFSGLRWSTEADLDALVLRHRRRWFLIAWGGEEELGAVERVECWQEVRGSGKNRRLVHPVALCCRLRRVELGAPGAYLAARRLAESAARSAQTALHDRTSGTTVVRPWDQLDTPAIRRATPADLVLPAPRPGSPLRIEDDLGGRQTVRIAPSSVALGTTLVIAIIMVAFPLVVLVLLAPGQPLIAVALTAIPAIGALLTARSMGAFGSRLVVDDGGLQHGSLHLACDEIEEIEHVAGPAWQRHLRVVSDRRELRLAIGHHPDDLALLRAVLLNLLSGRRIPADATGKRNLDR